MRSVAFPREIANSFHATSNRHNINGNLLQRRRARSSSSCKLMIVEQERKGPPPLARPLRCVRTTTTQAHRGREEEINLCYFFRAIVVFVASGLAQQQRGVVRATRSSRETCCWKTPLMRQFHRHRPSCAQCVCRHEPNRVEVRGQRKSVGR